MSQASDVFDRLNEWSRLSPSELDAHFDGQAVEILVSCSKLLLPATLAPEAVTRERFGDHVTFLRSVLVAGSRELGEAILTSSDLVDRGQRDAARTVLRDFVARCEAPFYRRIATRRLDALDQGADP